MKIYFSGSIRGGRGHAEMYASIISELRKYGEVLTEFVGDGTLTQMGSSMPSGEIYSRDVSFLRESDVVVAEVSTPSLGVGYEVAYAESLKLPIICLYREEDGKSLSAMIDGNPNIKVFRYNDISDVVKIFKQNITE